jgi:acyl-coenzyme A thioesterase PaaI-like protein
MSIPDARQRAETSLSHLSPPDAELAAAWLARLESGDGAQGGPFGRLLAARFTHFGGGECRAEMEVGPELYNPGGVLHGSIAPALIDMTMGGAFASLVGPDARLATIEIKVNYLRPVRRVC